jgi:hypothetical protein
MLEIIAIIYLSKNVGQLAYQKGLKVGWWKFYTIISWILFEIIGVVIGLLIFNRDNLVSIILVGYAAAITSFFILKAYLNKLPDHQFEDDIDQIGHNEQQ